MPDYRLPCRPELCERDFGSDGVGIEERAEGALGVCSVLLPLTDSLLSGLSFT